MDESSPDVRFFGQNKRNTSQPIPDPPKTVRPKEENDVTDRSRPEISFDPNSPYYDMTGDKYLIVFNHFKYKKTRYFGGKQPSQRYGTYQDVKSLDETFGGKLGFKVFVHHDLDHDDIITVVSKICKADHSSTSSICVAILTHGVRGGDVYAADRPYRLKDITTMFEQGNLVNKPKLFFVQACRGDDVDEGRTVYDGDEPLTIPSHADFLVLYSTVEGYLSYRECNNGSWMIQALCDVVKKDHENMDILHIIVQVNKAVAYNRLTNSPSNLYIDKKKQMTETRFTLTKLLKF